MPGPLQPAGRIWILCVVYVCMCVCALPDCSGSGPQRPTGSFVHCLDRPPSTALRIEPATGPTEGTQRHAKEGEAENGVKANRQNGLTFHPHTHTSDNLICLLSYCIPAAPVPFFCGQPSLQSSSSPLSPGSSPLSPGFFPPPVPFPFTLFIGGSCVHTHTTNSHPTNPNQQTQKKPCGWPHLSHSRSHSRRVLLKLALTSRPLILSLSPSFSSSSSILFLIFFPAF